MTDFEIWWSYYPRKVGKLAARREWQRLKKDGDLLPLPVMVNTLAEQCQTTQWQNPQFIPHPRTYLHQGRHFDEVSYEETVAAEHDRAFIEINGYAPRRH